MSCTTFRAAAAITSLSKTTAVGGTRQLISSSIALMPSMAL